MPTFTIEYDHEELGACIDRVVDNTPSYTVLARRVEHLRRSFDAKNIRVNGKNVDEVGFPRVTSWKEVRKTIEKRILKQNKKEKEINFINKEKQINSD